MFAGFKTTLSLSAQPRPPHRPEARLPSPLVQDPFTPLLMESKSGNALKALLFANADWRLFNFRHSRASGLREADHDVLVVSPPGPYGDNIQRTLDVYKELMPAFVRGEIPLVNHEQ